MRGWRNWQTRTFEGRMVIRVGSSPILRTKTGVFYTKNSKIRPLFLTNLCKTPPKSVKKSVKLILRHSKIC